MTLNVEPQGLLNTTPDIAPRSEPGGSTPLRREGAASPAEAPAKAPPPSNPAASVKPPAPAPAKPPAPASVKPPAPAPAKPQAPTPAKPPVSSPAKAGPPPAAKAVGVAQPPGHMAHDLLRLDATRLLKRQRNAFLLRVFSFVILPTAAAALYVYAYVTPRYVSEFQVMYVPTQASSANTSAASSLLGGLLGGSQPIDFNRVIGTYLISPTALEIANSKLDLQKKYSSSTVDWLNRMSKNASLETFLDYFHRRVNYWEQTGGFITVDVEGFSPKGAKDLADTLLAAADAMVAKINMRPLLDQVEFTRKEKENYRTALQAATDATTLFREEHNDYNFSESVAGLGGIVNGLQGQLAQARAKLAYQKHFLNADAPTSRALEGEIAGIESQIHTEQSRLASPSDSGKSKPFPDARQGEIERKVPTQRNSLPYSQVMQKYLDLVQAQEFATKAYLSAETAYEAAKLAAGSQPAYAVSFVPPNLPDHPTSPNPSKVILTSFLVALFTYSVGSLLIAMARDHAGA